DPTGAAAKTGQGLAILRRLGARKQGSTQALVRIADAFLTSNPAELQDPRFALACLEKAGEQASASGPNPSMLFLKAQAERRLGRNSQALATAQTALAQLAPANPGQPSTGMRQRIEKFLGR
ncbi:MAG: hypothetical protein NTW28_06955, partial [Candidatus Solibacter sp.]|nr:hypothetical protein [Candidatus Solibacter sp.]